MISEKFIKSVPVYDILTDLSLVAEDVSDDVRVSVSKDVSDDVRISVSEDVSDDVRISVSEDVPDVSVPTGRAGHAGDGGARPGPRQADADEGQGAADCRNHLNIT